jgi:hypothetical protein
MSVKLCMYGDRPGFVCCTYGVRTGVVYIAFKCGMSVVVLGSLHLQIVLNNHYIAFPNKEMLSNRIP